MTENLRKHCGVEPKIVEEYYPRTNYKMRRFVCPVCGQKTQAKRRLQDAVREWNNPEKVHLN